MNQLSHNESVDSYSILEALYSKQGHCSRDNESPETEKTLAILDLLNSISNTVELDRFTAGNAETYTGLRDKPHRLNIYYYPKSLDPAKQTVILLAHYDVVHANNDNVLDNLASVANIIAIGRQSIEQTLSINLVIALTDAEETVSFISSGAKRLSNRINNGYFGHVIETINLELTAYGELRWVAGNSEISKRPDVLKVHTPYNDSSVLTANNIPSTCIGIFTVEDSVTAVSQGYCNTWSLCHTLADKFNLANRTDMNNLVTWILNYLKGIVV